jgi:hypothetical protein
MTKRRILFAALSCSLWITSAQAAEAPGVYFQHADWELACDNTRTCRAAGYQADEDENRMTVLLTRAAGPGSTIRVQLQLADTASDYPPVLQMRINRRPLGAVRIDNNARGELSAAQVAALLPALLKNAPVTWHSGKTSWTLSTKGANAVLLKMDEFQGRIGTPAALVRKGAQQDVAVLPPLPLPELTAAQVGSDKPDGRLVPSAQRAPLLAALRNATGKQAATSCDAFDENKSEPEKLALYRLSPAHLLVSIGCSMGAYNSSDGYWVVDAQPPFRAVMVTNNGTDYVRGEIMSSQRGRGIGDCMASDTWTWDGRQFVHTASLTTGMCKEITAGGAWELPTLVTHVVKPR